MPGAAAEIPSEVPAAIVPAAIPALIPARHAAQGEARPVRSISIIVPALNESAGIREALVALQGHRASGHQVILVDGGSLDGTTDQARGLTDLTLVAERGRAAQMNAGAAAATGDALLFLHADTRLPAGTEALIQSGLRHTSWGRFDVRIAGRHPLFRCIEFAMNLRSRFTGIATGDQAIFVRRDIFEKIGGYAPIPLMEDIELCTRLRRIALPARLKARVTTSGRRWESRGVLRTMLLMWSLRLRFALGAAPEALAKRYR